MRSTKQRGVLSCNLCKLQTVDWKWLSITEISGSVSTREARPENSMGVPYSWCTFNEAVGLPWCPLASPADSTEAILDLCAEILVTI